MRVNSHKSVFSLKKASRVFSVRREIAAAAAPQTQDWLDDRAAELRSPGLTEEAARAGLACTTGMPAGGMLVAGRRSNFSSNEWSSGLTR